MSGVDRVDFRLSCSGQGGGWDEVAAREVCTCEFACEAQRFAEGAFAMCMGRVRARLVLFWVASAIVYAYVYVCTNWFMRVTSCVA